MDTIKARNINGENGVFVETGDKTFEVSYLDVNYGHAPERKTVVVTNVATEFDAIFYIEFINCGYAEKFRTREVC